MRDVIGEVLIKFGASFLAEAGDTAVLPANTGKP